MFQEFKSLAKLSKASVAEFQDDLPRLYHFLNIDATGHLFMATVIDHLNEKCISEVASVDAESGITRRQLKDIEAELVYESVIDELDNTEYLTLLKVFNTKQLLRPFSDRTAWIRALCFARDLILILPDAYKIDYTHLRNHYAKRYDIANAAKKLKAMGCEISFNGIEIVCGSGFREVVNLLESKIIYCGADFVISSIFGTLVSSNCYYPGYRRYVITSNIAFSSAATQVMTPFGYLLNLAVKHIGKPGAARTLEQRSAGLFEIEQLAQTIATIADARQYTTWETQIFNPHAMFDKIRSYALFDTIYAFPCASLTIAIDYMENLFKWVDEDQFRGYNGFSIQDIIEVTKAIDYHTPDTGLQAVYLSGIAKKLASSVPKDTIQKILSDFSHLPGQINQDFVFTDDFVKETFGQKPLIQVSSTKFLLCDKSWCAMAFYEVLALLVRKLDSTQNESNIKIGKALETFVHRRLEAKGISYSYGSYEEQTAAEGEADLLIESDNVITLVEIKKKALRRRSKGGSVIAALTDLAASLLEAQIQTGKVDLLIRKKGHIDLKNGKQRRVHLDGRQIERIALTQWDYGSFQDRSVIRNILIFFANHQVVLTAPENDTDLKAFKKLEKFQKIHALQANDLMELDPGFTRNPYFNCWFLSIPQFLMLIDISKNESDFRDALRSTKSLTMSSNNFYFEFYHMFLSKSKPG